MSNLKTYCYVPVRSSFEKLVDSQFNSFIDTFFNDSFTTQLAGIKDSYPKYNIIKHKDTDSETPSGFTVELSLAGFCKEALKVYTNKNILYVTIKDDVMEEERQYIYKGIATRKFNWSLPLPKYAKVSKTSFVNGILSIDIDLEIPEEEKPKVYEID